jgi:hypothetical protein
MKKDLIWGLIAVIPSVAAVMFVKSCGGGWDALVADVERKIEPVVETRARVDTLYDTARVSYVEYRDRVLKSGTATARDSVTFKKADAVVVACDTVRLVARQLDTLRVKEISILKAPAAAPRFQGYAEALADLARNAPVARLGLETRVVGRFYIVVAGEYDGPSGGQVQQLRGLVGGRINF